MKRLSVIRRNRLWELYSTEIHKDFFLIIALKSESGVEARELFLLNHSDKLLSAVLISWCWIQWDRPSDISLSLFQNWAIFHLSTRSHEMFIVFQFGHLLFPQERVTTVLNWFTELKTNRAENFMAENFRHGIRRWPSSLSASFPLLYWGGFSSLRQPRSLNLWFYVHKTS